MTASVLVLLLQQNLLDLVQKLLVNVNAFGALVANSDLLVAAAAEASVSTR